MSTERVFIVGGTGNIGKRCVNDLLKKGVAMTLYARNPKKVMSLFPQSSDLIQIIQGDFQNLTPIETGINGHTRLFLLISDFSAFVKTKEIIARYAYNAGVKQIVDISSFTVDLGWRSSSIGQLHYEAEKTIYDLPNRGYFVSLRASRFMSNHFTMSTPLRDLALFDTIPADYPQGWISTEDIGAVAAAILSDNFEKHGDAVYHLVGEVLTYNDRIKILSDILGKDIKYHVVSNLAKYEALIETGHFPHNIVIDFIDNLNHDPDAKVTGSIEILLGRKPQTLEKFLLENKSLIN